MSVRLEEGGIVADDAPIARARIADAELIPHGTDVGLPMLRLRLKDPIETRRVVVASLDEGRQALAHLGFDLAHGPARYSCMSPLLRFRGYLAAAAAVVGALAVIIKLTVAPSFNAQMIALGVLMVAGSAAFLPESVSIGLDGVRRKWIGRAHFVPISDVRAVHSGVAPPKAGDAELSEPLGTRFGVTVQRHQGEDLEIEVRDAEEAEIVAARVQEALDAAGLAEHPLSPALLRPPGASATEWIERLRAAGTGANATLRVAPVDEGELWSVLASASARPTDRAAAAVALAVQGDDARQRVRIAAEGVVEDNLRAALEAAAGEDEAALEAALARVDEDGAHRG